MTKTSGLGVYVHAQPLSPWSAAGFSRSFIVGVLADVSDDEACHSYVRTCFLYPHAGVFSGTKSQLQIRNEQTSALRTECDMLRA